MPLSLLSTLSKSKKKKAPTASPSSASKKKVTAETVVTKKKVTAKSPGSKKKYMSVVNSANGAANSVNAAAAPAPKTKGKAKAKAASNGNASANAARAGHRGPMTNSQIERDPVLSCKRTVRREIGASCMQDPQSCAIVQECGPKYGVGSDDWPLDVDRIPEDKFRLFFEKTLEDGSIVKNEEGIRRWREGRRCIRNVMGSNPQYEQMFQRCNPPSNSASSSKRNATGPQRNSRTNAGDN
jgi:hypothetical protein